jgi:lipoprotein NlpI
LAIKDYTVYLKAHPENPNAFEWRGVAFRSVGSYQPAINDFTTGMDLDPKKASLYTNRAIAYKLADMDKNATDDVIKARELGLDVSEQSLFSAIK